MLAHRTAEAEIVGIGQLAFMLDLLALDADVGNPVLSATVRAAGNMQPELLVKLRQALFELIHEPTRETLGLSDGELAEFCSGAGYRAAPEGRCLDMQANLFQLARQFRGLMVRNIYEQ